MAVHTSKGKILKESIGKPIRRPDKNESSGRFQSDFLPEVNITSVSESRSKNDLKHILDATFLLKKKQEQFEKLINSKLRELA